MAFDFRVAQHLPEYLLCHVVLANFSEVVVEHSGTNSYAILI